jgi:hypothetical protein
MKQKIRAIPANHGVTPRREEIPANHGFGKRKPSRLTRDAMNWTCYHYYGVHEKMSDYMIDDSLRIPDEGENLSIPSHMGSSCDNAGVEKNSTPSSNTN